MMHLALLREIKFRVHILNIQYVPYSEDVR